MLTVCHTCSGSGREGLRFTSILYDYCSKYQNGGCAPCSQLALIQDKVDEARHVLDELLIERDKMANIMNQHRDPFFHLLPAEVASRIFSFSLPLQPHPDKFATMASGTEHAHIKAVLTMGQVCRRWRLILQGTPEFWKFLPLNIKSERPEDVMLVQDWLKRSGAIPLFFHFQCRNNISLPHCTALLSPIISESRRIRRLSLRLPPNILSWILGSVTTSRLIQVQCIYITSMHPQPPPFLNAAPSEIGMSFGTVRLRNWDNLTVASVASVPFSDVLSILQRARNLQCCRLDSIGNIWTQPHAAQIVHPAMRCVRMHRMMVPTNLPLLTFSELREIELHNLPPPSWPIVRGALRRWKCPLKKLVISYTYIDESTLVELLKQIPTLEDLVLHEVALSRIFFTLATVPDPSSASTSGSEPHSISPSILQNLKTLSHQFPPGPFNFEWDALVPFLASRCTTSGYHTPLQFVEINAGKIGDVVPCAPMEQELRDLIKAAVGIELKVNGRMVDNSLEISGRL